MAIKTWHLKNFFHAKQSVKMRHGNKTLTFQKFLSWEDNVKQSVKNETWQQKLDILKISSVSSQSQAVCKKDETSQQKVDI